MSAIKRINEKRAPGYKGSQGAVLVVSLVLLLIMTLIGVAAIDSSTLQSQMARNSLFAQNLYQASRSEIEGQYEKLLGLPYMEKVMTSIAQINNHPAVSFSGADIATHGANPNFTQSTILSFTGDTTPPSGYSLGLFVGKKFEVNALSEVPNTGSESDQTQGLTYPAPL